MNDRERINEVHELVSEIRKDIVNMKIDMAEVKVDLRHHISRSDKHERIIMGLIIVFAVAGGIGAKWILPWLAKLL